MYIYIYIYMCVCVCMCVCEQAGKAVVQRALDDLSGGEGKCLAAKDYGKARIYFPDQVSEPRRGVYASSTAASHVASTDSS
jgi:hypothetical protein